MLLLCVLCGPVLGQPLREVQVRGIEGDERANVESALSLRELSEADRAHLTEARLSYLLRRAEEEAKQALRPYGYYGVQVETTVNRVADGITVTLDITPGEPVRVAHTEVSIEGEAEQDSVVKRALRDVRPRLGERLDHRRYEASKSTLQRKLAERGYFDAELVEHRIEIRSQTREAQIRLHWNSGPRYRFGAVTFEGAQIRAELLRQALPFESGELYHQRKLLMLHRRLTELDYFGYVDVHPVPDAAQDGRVPVQVSLAPGKRSVYAAGLSYGTDAGLGLQLGLERRWINARGHKFETQLDYAQRRQSLGLLYRIPAFQWIDGWYSFGANRREEESEFVDTRITELLAQRTGRLDDWELALGWHVRKEAFVLGRRPHSVTRGERRLVYPALSAERSVADDPLYPRRALSLRGEIRLGSGAIGSQTDFAQILFGTRFILALGENNRLLLRGQLGRTFTEEFDELPPSLRFYAGGDRSIRGYGYQEVGPRVQDQVIGGRNLLLGSAEFERMFSARWGGAVFIDAGDAFNAPDTFRLRTGVGAGVRWRSPVGMVRLDVAHGLDNDDRAVRLHLNVGPDL